MRMVKVMYTPRSVGNRPVKGEQARSIPSAR